MSNSSGKNVKLYRNSGRDKPMAHKKYVPQYQLMGIEPEEVRSAVVPDGLLAKVTPQLPLTNPRARRAPVRQPYARVIPSPIGRGKDPVPNVGNNMEHTWSSIDGEIIDDLSPEMDESHTMIDNNDFVDGSTEETFVEDNNEVGFMTTADAENSNLPETLPTVGDDEYILLVDSTVISVGSQEKVEEEVKFFVFGEHDLCAGVPVSVEKITVLKKVKIKVGVFLA